MNKFLTQIKDAVVSQLNDPAIHRAILLGGAAYFIRRAPFLDEATAEGLSDKALIVVGVLLSKLPGTQELINKGMK